MLISRKSDRSGKRRVERCLEQSASERSKNTERQWGWGLAGRFLHTANSQLFRHLSSRQIFHLSLMSEEECAQPCRAVQRGLSDGNASAKKTRKTKKTTKVGKCTRGGGGGSVRRTTPKTVSVRGRHQDANVQSTRYAVRENWVVVCTSTRWKSGRLRGQFRGAERSGQNGNIAERSRHAFVSGPLTALGHLLPVGRTSTLCRCVL